MSFVELSSAHPASCLLGEAGTFGVPRAGTGLTVELGDGRSRRASVAHAEAGAIGLQFAATDQLDRGPIVRLGVTWAEAA